MKRILAFMLMCLLVGLIACSQNNPQETLDESANINVIAEEFISLLASSQFEEASQLGDASIKADDLKHTWESLEKQIGDMIEQEHSTTTVVNGLDVVMIIGRFNDTDVMFNISFNEDQQIVGFYVQ